MSVIKSKRSVAKTQFLFNLQKLENEVLTWCKQQGYRSAQYGLTELFGFTNKAFSSAYYANKTFLKDEESLKIRTDYFNTSIKCLHLFNAKLTSLMSCYDISNTKIKRWMGYVYKAMNQMESVKKSDSKRISNKKEKEKEKEQVVNK